MSVRLLGLSLLLTGTVTAEDYTLTPPKWPQGKDGIVFQFFLPNEDGFSSNINLMIQPYPGTIEQYEALSKGQLKQLKGELLSSEVKGNELLQHYRGDFTGRMIDFTARAIKVGNKVHLLTVTCHPDRTETDGKTLKKTMMSYKPPTNDSGE